MLHEIRPQIRARRPRHLILALGLAALLIAWPVEGADARGIVSVERDIDNQRERAIAGYWTARRIRRAEPLAPVPAAASPRQPRRSIRGKPGYLPPVSPGGGPTPRWRRGSPDAEEPTPPSGAAFESGPVEAFDSPPNTTAGKLYGRLPGFGKYECSATAVSAPNRSVVFTAGHCLGEQQYGLARNVVFIPSFNYEERPFGTWVGQELLIPRPWLRRENFSYDFGALVVSRRDGTALEEIVGGRGFAYNQPREQIYTAIGYPGNHDDAQRMWYCRSGFRRNDERTSESAPAPLAISCDMGLGASGGGWVISDQYVNSVSSYFYPRNDELLYGPYFGDRAQRLVVEAGSS
jgi:hypothetical protein